LNETPEETAARVRDTLPVFLLRPQSELDADKEAMKLRAASFTRSRLTPEERDISRGAQLEEIARANLETQESLRAEGRNVSTRGGANLEMVEQETLRLAEGLELQGRFREAADIHPRERERERLLKIEEAIERPDTEFCDCPVDSKEIQGRTVEADPHFEVKRVYSRHHGRAVSLVACRKCPGLNATSTPPAQLAKTLAAVGASHGAAMAQGMERLRRARR
jgi:hypothetical protein